MSVPAVLDKYLIHMQKEGEKIRLYLTRGGREGPSLYSTEQLSRGNHDVQGW